MRAYIYTPLFVFLLFVSACSQVEPQEAVSDPETTPTMSSTNRTIVYSGNGYKRFRMFAPEILLFELAERPYALYPKGITVETFKDSTAGEIASKLTADYAKYYTNEKIWEATGNVVGDNFLDDRSFKTERLYWQEKDGRIYSDTTTTVRDGRSITRGRNFETDQSFEKWTFNNAAGKVAVDQTANDSTSTDSTAQIELTPTSATHSDSMKVVEQKVSDVLSAAHKKAADSTTVAEN